MRASQGKKDTTCFHFVLASWPLPSFSNLSPLFPTLKTGLDVQQTSVDSSPGTFWFAHIVEQNKTRMLNAD